MKKMKADDKTTIPVKVGTRKKLKDFKVGDENWNDLMQRIIKILENNKKCDTKLI